MALLKEWDATLAEWVPVGYGTQGPPGPYGPGAFTWSYDGDLTPGYIGTHRFSIDDDSTLTRVRVRLVQTPADQAAIFDIMLDGATSIFAGIGGTPLTIPIGVDTVIWNGTINIDAGHYLTSNILQAGISRRGSDPVVQATVVERT